jgi:sugar O-acyltransferase (sialic acid O-acetyltransferase NeuD family)
MSSETAREVIIYRAGQTGRMVYYDSLNHPTFKIACFAMEEKYLTGEKELFGIPVVSDKEVREMYPPHKYDMLVADERFENMRDRMEKYYHMKRLGYRFTNYISAQARVEPGIEMGENNIIFGQVHLGFGGKLGSNNVIRQQVYLGHNFNVGNNNVFKPGARIGGFSVIKDYCFIGMGAVVKDEVTIERGSLIGAGCVMIRNVEPYSVNVGNPGRIIRYNNPEDFNIAEE